jgi:multidrug efflux pump subunit AcrB
MWLIKASLRNPYMVATIVFMVLFLGILSVLNIRIDILPAFKTPAVQVITYYQGMPASSIEKTISNRIERWVNQAPGASLITSKSIPGVSVVRVYFRDDTDPNAALTMTGQLALGTLPTLPPNTLPPVVLPFDPTATMPLGVLTVENPFMDEASVKDVARIQVRSLLGAVPGCVAPVVVGGKDRTILVYLDPQKLEAHHLSMLDVVKALKEGNMMITPGIAYFGNNQVLLDTNMMVNEVKELDDLPLRIDPHTSVYLRDVGHAEDSYAIQTSRVRIVSPENKWEGARQVYVPIYRQMGASSLEVANGVKEKLKYIMDRCPAGTKLDFVMDQSLFIEESIKSLINEGIVGAVLVSIMLLIFLGNWRMTLIATMSIPLAILGAISCLYATGQTINAMTLGGLSLAIGPLVDDAIVELENNHRNYSLGKSRIRAALDGCAEVMVPVLVATCTTNIVLAPLAFMPGMGGFLFRPLALAVTFAMFSSFLLSRTFVPMMCAKFLPDEHLRKSQHAEPAAHGEPGASATGGGHGEHGHGEPTTFFGRIHHRIEGMIDASNRSFTRTLESILLRHRFKLLSFIGVMILVAGFLFTRIGREFFPQVDAGQITIEMRAPSNLRLDAAEERVKQMEKVILGVIPHGKKDSELETIVTEMGVDPDWSSAYTDNSGQQDAIIRIQLTEKRAKSAQEYAALIREAVKKDKSLNDLRVSFGTGGIVSNALNNGAASPIDIQLAGVPSLPRADKDKPNATFYQQQHALEIAQEVRRLVSVIPGVADARVLQRLDAPYQIIEVDRQKAASVGLSPYEVIQQVVAALNSSISINRNFWIDMKTGNQYFVAVQYPDNPSMRLDGLLDVEATGQKQGLPVKLSSLAHFRRTQRAVEVNHENLQPIFNIQLNVKEGYDLGTVAGAVEKKIAALRDNLPRAYKLNEVSLHKLRAAGVPEEAVKRLRPLTRNNFLPPSDFTDDQKQVLGGDYDKYKDVVQQNAVQRQEMFLAFKGEFEHMNEATSNLLKGMLGAVVLVYLLQVALFRSWIGPIIIMATVPLGLIGVAIMLWATNTTLNVQSEMGAIFLVGIEVNTGVLIIEFANKQRKLGLSVRDAVVAAASTRFRPILMTFLACFIDLLPMAFNFDPLGLLMGGSGRGSEANVPLARAVVGGLLFSFLFSRFVLPVLYTLLTRDGPVVDADIERELEDRPEVAVKPVTDGAHPAPAIHVTVPDEVAVPVHSGANEERVLPVENSI